jgi:phospholipid/cholesterol/gamma-HCH transport system permease protein
MTTVSTIGHCTINLFRAFSFLFKGEINLKNTIVQAAIIGFDSAPIAIIISMVSGAVLALQVAKQFIQNGADAYIGGLVAITIIREMAPLFSSLAIGARAGTAITAETANMKVTEQVDALKLLDVDPVYFLILPRIIAGALMIPLVTIISEIMGVLGGMIVAKVIVNLHFSRYLQSVWLYADMYDIKTSLYKSAIFGVLITVICVTIGLLTEGGAKEVGKSTTRAAIWTATAVIIADYLLTWIFYGSGSFELR